MTAVAPNAPVALEQVIVALEQIWSITLEDIEDDWTYVMTKRLLKEMNRQIAAMEAIKYDNATAQPAAVDRLTNARTLASLQGTLKELMRMKTLHEVKLETRKARKYVDSRTEIKLLSDQRAAAKRTG
ncbi:MAG TPA: hypothetical protein VGF56_04950 [Rhizomicrobium sp.]|jgi:hypothetical protein